MKESRIIPLATTDQIGMTKPPAKVELSEIIVASLVRRAGLTEAEARAAAPALIRDLEQAGVVKPS